MSRLVRLFGDLDRERASFRDLSDIFGLNVGILPSMASLAARLTARECSS